MTTEVNRIEKVLTTRFSPTSSLLVVKFQNVILLYDYSTRNKVKTIKEGYSDVFPLDDERLLILKGGFTGFFIYNWSTEESRSFYQAMGDGYRFVTGITLENGDFVLINETGALFFYLEGLKKKWIIQTPLTRIERSLYYNVTMHYKSNYLLILSKPTIISSRLVIYFIKKDEEPILIYSNQLHIDKSVLKENENENGSIQVIFHNGEKFIIFSINNENTVVLEKEIPARSFSISRSTLIPLKENKILLHSDINKVSSIYDISTGNLVKKLKATDCPILVLEEKYLLFVDKKSHLYSLEEDKEILLPHLNYRNQIPQDVFPIPTSKFRVTVLRCLLVSRLKLLIPKDLIRELYSFLNL